MKKRIFRNIFFCSLLLSSGVQSFSQCASGFNTATTNWDNLDYLVSTGFYAPATYWPGVPAALASNQAFAIGRNRFTIQYAGGVACTLGENTTNTAEGGSFGAGADVQYANNGTVTITFDTVVYNVQFSLYDIDQLQVATVTATDPSAAALNVNMAVVTAGYIAVVGSGGVAPVGTSIAAAANNADTRGSLNIGIPGGAAGVKQIVITLSGGAGDWWLSDISACVYGSFTTNYFVDAKPFTGQKAFVLATPDSTIVSYIDSATAKATYLFTGNFSSDPNNPLFVNGLAYDHKKHYVYYVHDFGTRSHNSRSLRRWNYNTEAIDALNIDVNTLGIPTFDMGVESAGSAFYDGALYFGVEAQSRNFSGPNDSTNISNRESIVWRIEFDASDNPVKSCQVFASPADNGSGSLLLDWNDFTLKDGMLYNFMGGSNRYQHYNLQTGNLDQNYSASSSVQRPRQTAITWSGKIMWLYDSLTTYNETGTITVPKKKITGTSPANMSPDWAKGIGPGGLNIGASGDAAGPFKPKTDFGDAPASYDPSTGDPATHERDTTLRIGAAYDREFSKTSSALADGDGADEDGITPFVPIFSPGTPYLAAVNVYNNTGSPATLIAWLDDNGDGDFDSGEACNTVAVPSMTTTQTRYLYWPTTASVLANGTYTYMRIRLTSASNGMTASNPTGYFDDGEVEDYRVQVDNFPLATKLISFDAALRNEKVELNWKANEQPGIIAYNVERSRDNATWERISFVPANGTNGTFTYAATDANPAKDISYYRIQVVENTGMNRYSQVRTINNREYNINVLLAPNPAKLKTTLKLQTAKPGEATVQIVNMQGKTVRSDTYKVNAGSNIIDLYLSSLGSGMYVVKTIIGEEITYNKLTINK